MNSQHTCSRCGGRGKIVDDPCKKCGGKGKVRAARQIEINIPAGIDNGQVVTVRGNGDAGMNGGPAGDLHIEVRIKKHKDFTRDGYNVWYNKHVSITEATLGAELQVPTLDGNVKYNMPAGTQPGAVFKLKGKGIQRLNSVGKGDEYVQIIVDIPTGLTHEQKELLRTFDKSYTPPKNPPKEGFLTNSRRNKYKEKSALQGLQCAFCTLQIVRILYRLCGNVLIISFPRHTGVAAVHICLQHLRADIGGQVNDFLALSLPFFLFVLLRHKKITPVQSVPRHR